MAPTQSFKYVWGAENSMRPLIIFALALLLVSVVTAAVGDQLPTAPPTPDPNYIPNATGGGGTSTYVITVLAPTGTVPAPTVKVAYRHNAATARTCIVTIDDYDWDIDDPRWDDPLFVKQATVAPNTTRNETFTGILAGTHIFAFYCATSTGTDMQEEFREITVTGGTTTSSLNATVNITSPGAITGTDITIAFRHNGTASGACTIEIDDDELTTIITPVNSASTYRTTVSLGSHELVVDCVSTTWSARAVHTFRARAGTNTSSDNPILRLRNGGVAVDPNTPFTLVGSKFPPDDIIELTITGGGAADAGEAETSSTGAFEIEHDGLPSGSYRITARSSTESGSVAVLLLTVRGLTPDPTPTLPPVPGPIPDPLPNPTPSYPDPWPTDPVDDPYIYPDPVDPMTESPSDVGASIWVWLLPMLLVLLLVGGTAGYLAREGMLDVTSWSGFTQSVDELVHGRGKQRSPVQQMPQRLPPASVVRPPTQAERTTLRGFIARERKDGADDLAIRGALLAKGWEKSAVDGVFDEIYREQRTAKK